MTSLGLAWRTGRSRARERAARRPSVTALTILATLVTVLAARLPLWRRARSAVMQWSGLGLLSYAAFQWHLLAGLVAAGLSLLVLEALGRDGGERR